jgi:hypothetical protein
VGEDVAVVERDGDWLSTAGPGGRAMASSSSPSPRLKTIFKPPWTSKKQPMTFYSTNEQDLNAFIESSSELGLTQMPEKNDHTYEKLNLVVFQGELLVFRQKKRPWSRRIQSRQAFLVTGESQK